MNIMYCLEGFPYPSRGGISQVTIRQSQYFQVHCKMECHCLCLRIENECTDTSTFSGHLIVDYSKGSAERIATYIAEHKIAVVVYQVVWNFRLFEVVAKACRLSGAKLVTAIHGLPAQGLKITKEHFKTALNLSVKERIIKILLPLYLRYFYCRDRRQKLYMYNHSARFVSLTEQNSALFAEHYQLDDVSKLAQIANPLTFDTMATIGDIAAKEPIVLIVGRFEESTKRISTAIKIWGEIEKRGCGDWRLVIVGSGDSESDYKKSAKELALKNVSFEGRQAPLPYFQKASIFMMTSATEGFGVTLTEAQQNGVVPIAFDAFVALRYIVQDGVNGVVVDNNDVAQYVEKLYDLMHDSQKRSLMARQAVENSKRFAIDTICTQWLNLFNGILTYE